MATTEQTKLELKWQFKAIELLYHHLNAPTLPIEKLVNFNFIVNLETRADVNNKFVFVVVSADIKNEEQTHLFSSFGASCIFFVDNFEEIVKIAHDGKIEIHKDFKDVFNSVSISTLRGLMFGALKGTYLHNAVLPLIDPTKLAPI